MTNNDDFPICCRSVCNGFHFKPILVVPCIAVVGPRLILRTSNATAGQNNTYALLLWNCLRLLFLWLDAVFLFHYVPSPSPTAAQLYTHSLAATFRPNTAAHVQFAACNTSFSLNPPSSPGPLYPRLSSASVANVHPWKDILWRPFYIKRDRRILSNYAETLLSTLSTNRSPPPLYSPFCTLVVGRLGFQHAKCLHQTRSRKMLLFGLE